MPEWFISVGQVGVSKSNMLLKSNYCLLFRKIKPKQLPSFSISWLLIAYARNWQLELLGCSLGIGNWRILH